MDTISFEGFDLGAGDILEASIIGLLEGRRFPHRDGHDHYVHQWLARLWKSLKPEGRGLVTRVIARTLTSPHLRARSEAIRFFQSCAADDEGALRMALETSVQLFEGVEDPIAGATGDMHGELLRAIANDIDRARDAIEQLRREALRPEKGGPVVVGLLQADPAWVRDNAAEIVRNTPGTYVTLLVNFALHRLELTTFVRAMRAVFSDTAAEAILRERLATRPDELAECLEVLREPT